MKARLTGSTARFVLLAGVALTSSCHSAPFELVECGAAVAIEGGSLYLLSDVLP